jgi:hypothetical protein
VIIKVRQSGMHCTQRPMSSLNHSDEFSWVLNAMNEVLDGSDLLAPEPLAQPSSSTTSLASLATLSSSGSLTPHAFAARLDLLSREFRSAVSGRLILQPPIRSPVSTVDQYRRLFPVWGSLLEPMATLTTAILYYTRDADTRLLGAFHNSALVRGVSDEAFIAIIQAYRDVRDRGLLEPGE